ncbi:hypothetical protein Cylst_0227 [Cylindrospermum stagnale PCC 7417]|uniref:Uncharacterized protein n=1 Tax=Cylindrospermum stagnale PCC 7417 TaxID=56107 RepID=K9WSX2_9NOST|nr:hypothetical protein [Cylindrospermum stagnale]AFZ22602.1 hypothetical protein Cylst_0227 [Cylindrospermum stagnale PCC 7417]
MSEVLAVGWGATHVWGFQELSEVAFEERNPTPTSLILINNT